MTRLIFNLEHCTEANVEERFKAVWNEVKRSNNEAVTLVIKSTGTLELGDVNHTLATFLELLPRYKQIETLELINFTANEISEVALTLQENQSSSQAPLSNIKSLILHPLIPASYNQEIQKDYEANQAYFKAHRAIVDGLCVDLAATKLIHVVIADTSTRYPQRSLMRSLANNLDCALEDTSIKLTVMKPQPTPTFYPVPAFSLGTPYQSIKRLPPPEEAASNKKKYLGPSQAPAESKEADIPFLQL